MSTKVLLTAVSVTLMTVVAVPAAGAGPETTLPGVLYINNVTLTDNKIAITHNSPKSVTRLPRGAFIRYVVRNKGTRTYIFKIWGTQTNPIKPGGKDSIAVNWDRRGQFAYFSLFRGKPASRKGYINVY
jgi:hypothetical protein